MFEHLPVERPYPGLRPFEPHEGEIFFGREGHTDRLLEILQRERFLAVIGPSGGGKSSLVRAGLLPALAGGRLGTGSHWRLALLRPGGQPLLALAQALTSPYALGHELQVHEALLEAGLAAAPMPATAEQATPDAAMIASELRQGHAGFERLLAQAQARRLALRPPDMPLPTLNLLVLADQFEELFTYRSAGLDPAEPARFVELLLGACRCADGPLPEPAAGGIRVVVALTMRTDFLGHCVEFADLPEAINRAQYLTPRLKRQEMRDAIVGPARLFDGDVEEGFAQAAIDEAGTNSDQLPLLQHALAQWWLDADGMQHPLIDAESTEKAGKLSEALNLHANRLFHFMTAAEQQACEALFRAITAGREGADAVRRPQRLEDIAAWSGEAQETLSTVVRQLCHPEVSFLHHGRTLSKDSVIDLTHEALMRQWGMLKDWVASELRRGQGWQRWQARAAEHAAGDGGLLVGADLARALDWWNPGAVAEDGSARWQPTPAWAKRYAAPERALEQVAQDLEVLQQYLLDSRDQARQAEARLQREADEAQARAEREKALAVRARQSAGRARRVSWLAVLIALVTLVTAGMAAQQYRATHMADRARTESLFESQLTQASLLARADDYAAARQVLLESAQLDNAVSLERRQARNLLAGHIATMGGASDKVYTDGGKALPPLSGGVSLSPDGGLLVAAGEKGTLVLFDAASGRVLKRLEGHDPKADSIGSVRTAVFAPDGRSVYSGADDGRVIRWAIPSGEKLGAWNVEEGVRALAMRPDGRQLAVARGRQVELRALPQGKVERELKGHEDLLGDGGGTLAYSPDGRHMASASYDGSVRLWDVSSGKTLHVLRHTDNAQAVAFSPDGLLLATSSGDHRVMLWSVATGQQLLVLSGHQNAVFGLCFSGDGQTLYSASRDLTLRAWDVAGGGLQRVWRGHESGLTGVVLAHAQAGASAPESEPWAYTGANDGTLRRWPLMATGIAKASGPQGLPGFWSWTTDDEKSAVSAGISPDGRWVAIGHADGSIRMHGLPAGEVLGEMPKAHDDQVLRVAFSPDGSRLVTSSHDNTAKLWAVTPRPGGELALSLLHTFDEHKKSVYSVAFSADGRWLATAGLDGQVGLFDAATFKGRLVKAHDGLDVSSVSFEESGQRLLTTGDDLRVRLWRMDNWGEPDAVPRDLVRLQDVPMWASLSSDGRRVAVVGRGASVTLVDLVRPGDVPRRLVGHENTVFRSNYAPDGRLLATVGSDKTLRIWDLREKQEGHRLLFTQRLPAMWKEGQNSPLWDFDFRCIKDSGDCIAVVPLTMGRVVVYRWPYMRLPDGWAPSETTARSMP